jgi:drug/metabolite transporter (DMT)-like permease
MQQPRKTGLGLGLALLSSACFSTSGPFARSLTGAGWSSAAAVSARIGLAALVLTVPAVLAMRGRWHVLRRNLGMVSGYGLIPVAGGQVFFFNAVQTLSVGVALLLEYLGLVLVVAWMWLRHGQKPRLLTVIGSLVALAGLVLILDLTGDTRLDLAGVLWALGGAVALATFFVLSSKSDGELPPVALASAGMSVGAAALLALGALGALPLRVAFTTVDLGGVRAPWLVPVVGLALIAAAIAYVAGIFGARQLGARLASFLGLTEVAFAVLFAWLLLGELPTWMQLAGGILIIGGVALVRLDEMRPHEPVLEEPLIAVPAGVGSERGHPGTGRPAPQAVGASCGS